MPDSNGNRALALLLLRTIAAALVIYGVVQLTFGFIGRARGLADAAPFTTQGILHGLAGLLLWLLAGPAAGIIARRLK